MNKLYKSSTDKMLWGICGGLAEYWGVDSTLIRLAWAAITLFSGGIGVIGYIVAAIIIPNE